jgi:RimJ/RimL family protein N-acetyltransferase
MGSGPATMRSGPATALAPDLALPDTRRQAGLDRDDLTAQDRGRRLRPGSLSAMPDISLPIGAPVPGWSARPRPPREPVDGRWARLEPLDPARHGPAIHAANTEDAAGAMWRYLPYGPFPTLADWTRWAEPMATFPDPLFYAVLDRDTGQAAGVAAYLAIVPEHGSIEVGHIALAPRLQRTRAATDAMFLMARTVFDLGYRRYEWKCDSLNAPSRAAAQRFGFSYEGVFRHHRVVKDHNRDSAWYAMTDADWPALRAGYERWLAPASFDAAGRQRERLSDLTAPLLVARG